MMTKKELIEIRDQKPEDDAFIYCTWMNGVQHGTEEEAFTDISGFVYSVWIKFLLEKEQFTAAFHKHIDEILKRKGVKVRVACLKEDPDVVLGYAVTEGQTLHWIFIKEAWRKLGLAKDLVESPINQVTHLTNKGKRIMVKKFPELKFNPFA